MPEVALACSIFSLFITVMSTAYIVLYRFASMDVKMDVVWRHVIDTALSAAFKHEIVDVKSPVELTSHADGLFASLHDELIAFYRKVGWQLSDEALYVETQLRFGERLLTEVALPNKLLHNEVILAATLLMKKEYAKIQASPDGAAGDGHT